MSKLVEGARKTVKWLEEQQLLDGEHALTAALIESLADEWDSASAAQRPNIAREIRGAIKLLPSHQGDGTGATEAFLAGLAGAAKTGELPPSLF